jgi:hypothetical protein
VLYSRKVEIHRDFIFGLRKTGDPGPEKPDCPAISILGVDALAVDKGILTK